ncbi:MaoC family dehydratase [Weizmannia acidilactici]|uniref:MaoC family dehydratase n=1 Tax=Weizmannia acidilactici TaxID=2607726 RepID=A0A5J4JIS8_9BACI|nr:MaoC/PaaZ C-terminal domain-containing protein [Weizmannia acidilactici]GER66633.1 MaoC family dehydratase [Weizmannia acidilactici]GER68904.1 MaoC family dehydratase [Weizmannia acidilactici]GER73532.1 MaoC family dehydratase [Weizmannia acidilactici]
MSLRALKPGERLKPAELPPVSRMDLIKYSGASGDFNPIHTIDEAAKKAGLPGIIAHGMWTMGNLGKLFTPYYEAGYIEKFTVRFSGMVFLGDRLTLTARLKHSAEGRQTFETDAVNQDGVKVIKGEVVFKLFSP